MSKTLRFSDRLFISADRFPERPAIWIDGRSYSYAEFSSRVKNIHHLILSKKIKNKRIALWAAHHIDTYAALFAICMAGYAYIPLNINHPAERIKNIIKQAGIDDLISPSGLPEDLQLQTYQIIYTVEDILYEHYDISSQQNSVSDEAVVIFTSGSTAEPKGVSLHHQGINSMLDNFLLDPFYSFSEKDRFLQVFDLSFDFSIFSLMMPISLGACCYILPQKSVKTFDIIRMLENHHISILAMIPNVLHLLRKYLGEIHLPALRYSFFGGDALFHDLAVMWKKSAPDAEIINVYGPTESSVICSTYHWNEQISEVESVDGIVPLGKLFPGIHYLILDEEDEKINNHEIGELCLTGVQIINSYLNPNQNTDKFIKTSTDHLIYNFYKTADMASVNSNGNLIFHGRKDRQVKLSGYRIELNEIDYNLYLANEKAVYSMLVKDETSESNQIISFVEDNERDEKMLKTFLSLHIPAYMMPRKIIFLNELPYNTNGKIDRSKLLEKWNSRISIDQ